MSIPVVSGVLRGWTKSRKVRVVTKNIINYVTTQTAENIYMDIMIQPLQAERVKRKPEEQRAWKWYSLLAKASNRPLKIDDILTVDDISYRVDSVQGWTEAGYRRYEVTEDYTGSDPVEAL